VRSLATEEEIRAGIEAVKNWPFQNHRAVLLPFQENNLEVFPEDFIARMYYKIKADGTMALAFPSMQLNHLNRFITYVSNIKLGFVIGCLKTPTKPKPVGWAYLTEVDGEEGQRKASFAFGFFKEIHGRREHVDLSMFYLKYWFDNFGVNQLYGTTLNPLALNYSKRFGFERLCVLPKFFSGKPASLITLTPEAFQSHYDAWKLTTSPGQQVPTLSPV
jgi:hypothetical protein